MIKKHSAIFTGQKLGIMLEKRISGDITLAFFFWSRGFIVYWTKGE
jgi:hypothetical protein